MGEDGRVAASNNRHHLYNRASGNRADSAQYEPGLLHQFYEPAGFVCHCVTQWVSNGWVTDWSYTDGAGRGGWLAAHYWTPFCVGYRKRFRMKIAVVGAH